MSIIRITKIFRFEMAHLLQHHDGLCRNIHGHSYQLEVCASGHPLYKPGYSKDGMVWDFKDMKHLVQEEILDTFDHAMVINSDLQQKVIATLSDMSFKIVCVPFEPTSENLVSFFALALSKKMPPKVKLVSLRLYETSTSFAEWMAADNM